MGSSCRDFAFAGWPEISSSLPPETQPGNQGHVSRFHARRPTTRWSLSFQAKAGLAKTRATINDFDPIAPPVCEFGPAKSPADRFSARVTSAAKTLVAKLARRKRTEPSASTTFAKKVCGVWLPTDDAEVPLVVSADGKVLPDAEHSLSAHRHTTK